MALLDSLLGNEAKRFVKRKDSDAGEAGLTKAFLGYISIYLFILFFFLSQNVYMDIWVYIIVSLNIFIFICN